MQQQSRGNHNKKEFLTMDVNLVFLLIRKINTFSDTYQIYLMEHGDGGAYTLCSCLWQHSASLTSIGVVNEFISGYLHYIYIYIFFNSLWYVKYIIQGTNKYWDWFENNRYSPRYRDRYLIETKTKYSLRPYFEEITAIFHWALTISLAPLTIYFMIISLSPYNTMTSILLLFLLHNEETCISLVACLITDRARKQT